MVPLIEQNRNEIEKLCRTYHVARLELFGSAARGDFDEQTSDCHAERYSVKHLAANIQARSLAEYGSG